MGNFFCQKLTVMDENFDKKTLKVSGVSQLLEDQITKEFQKNGNSTGYRDDVNRLHVCPNDKDYVLVEFANNVPGDIGDTLDIGGTKLKVEHWNSQTALTEDSKSESLSKIWSDNDNEIFQHHGETRKKHHRKEARSKIIDKGRPGLNPDQETTTKIPFSETKVKLNDDVAKKVQEEAECQDILKKNDVKLDKSGYLTGTGNAIFAVGGKLVSYFSGSGETGNANEQGVKQPDEKLGVNSQFLRYIVAYHYEVFQKLENVSKEISFEMISKSDKDMKIFARDGVDKTTFLQTVESFIGFYQAMHEKMHQEVIPISSQVVKSVISEARLKFPVVIDLSDEPEKITIYGERDKVQDALTFLKGKVGDFHTGSSSSKAEAATGKKVRIEKLSCVLYKKIKVSVYQGDITKETSDVIVNPANENLKHDGGAAAAIVKAGGESIQTECDESMKRRRYYSLNAGDVVVTKAGNLPCKLIVHAVGPRWYNYYNTHKNTAKNALYAAIVNSLTVACTNGATSISIPAISSGIFGVPVEICAEVLFNAASNFAKNAAVSDSLKEIRFVNIDKSTSQVFAQEMQKQFHGSIQREHVEVFHSSNAGRTDRSNGDGQSQLNRWEQNQMTPTKPSGAVDARTKVPYGGSHDSGLANDKKGNQGKESNLNPSAPAFSGKLSSSTPGSYSNAVTGNAANEKEKKPKPDPKSPDVEKCSICLCDFTDKKTLHKCSHSFCSGCIDEAFKHQKKCPICSQVYGTLVGNQPPGKMNVSYSSLNLPGYESYRTITINYKFESGVQGPNHPNPGKHYHGTMRNGYLPDNKEGRKVLKLLRKAFDQKLTFTIGRSSTSGANNVITWNDIHHKTSLRGGPTNFGYPDPDYLKRVQEELAAKGITE